MFTDSTIKMYVRKNFNQRFSRIATSSNLFDNNINIKYVMLLYCDGIGPV